MKTMKNFPHIDSFDCTPAFDISKCVFNIINIFSISSLFLYIVIAFSALISFDETKAKYP